MGLCFGSLAHREQETSLNRPHYSGSASPESKNVESSTTNCTVVKSQFSMIANGRVDESIASSNGQVVIETPNSLKVFSFGDLKAATKNFKSDTLLGEGGFGKVYKGWLDEKTLSPSKAGSGMMVAIKKLNPESMQGFQEWQSEVNFLGSLSHPNLIKLLGYCWEDEELLLVYEFMPKGSLENHLFRRNPNIEPLSWNTRLKIVITNYNAKISNFGLAKLGPTGGESHVTTRIMDTYGYAAPEYIATGHLYVKSDVYGFGVVLLEMLTGLRALDTKRPHGQQNLVEWVKPCLSNKGKLKTIMDAKIKGQYSLKAALQAAQFTLKWLDPDPKHRPSMKDAVEALEGIEAIQSKSKGSMKCCSRSTALHHPQKLIHHQSLLHDGQKVVKL